METFIDEQLTQPAEDEAQLISADTQTEQVCLDRQEEGKMRFAEEEELKPAARN